MTLHRIIIFYQKEWTTYRFWLLFDTFFRVSRGCLFSYNALTEWRLGNSWNWTMASCLCKSVMKKKWMYSFTELNLCVAEASVRPDLMCPSDPVSEQTEHQNVRKQQSIKVALQTQKARPSHTTQQLVDSGNVWRWWKLQGALTVSQWKLSLVEIELVY